MHSFKQYLFESIDNLTFKSDIVQNAIGGKNEKISVYDNENEVAYIKNSIFPEYVNIAALYVIPEYRKQGLAKKLLQTIINKYSNQKIIIRPYAYKDAPMSDEQLETFYKHMGFKDDPYKPKHYLVREPK